ncbi:df9ff971-06fe-425b-a800-f5dd901ee745 [Sclerotinia trifoliorum]|uniref:Df9ff971-06fe-425b-a800-f5dd901ee745 n=1 Tax=Sclerotinia trifoliorum TaxID=28548 RepID=A0A8H2VNW9_9HELO|nr:df9ff971-06fe-425b-a800-f5dd901ee745 [Sclerotinia trifoliorum]
MTSTTMEAIKELSLTTGTAIMDVVFPTTKIMVPNLLKNKSSILSVPRSTHSYGSHPRHTLDLYPSSSTSSSSPILIYLYGGGLVYGDKILDIPVLENLVYHNLGAFFAKRGITTIIPDYRRVDTEAGGEGAIYPSGAEDISTVLQWLSKTDLLDGKGNKRDVYLMGNSAGGLHIATYLLEPRYLEERKSWQGESNVSLKGFVGVGVPYNFDGALADRKETLDRYYGSDENIETKSPYGLLKVVGESKKSRDELGIPKLLVLYSEWDPVDEILKSNHDFVKLAEEAWGEKIEVIEIQGHNHISPPMALSSGEGEEWGEQAARWIKGNA